MIEIREIKVPYGSDIGEVIRKACRKAGISHKDIKGYRILKRSVDARRGREVSQVYNLGLALDGEERLVLEKGFSVVRDEPYWIPVPLREHRRPVIAGYGPAGMFCAYVLAKAGMKPIVLERGKTVDERAADVERFWREGKLDPASNVQFGEGGAGTFSDGKLTTGTHDRRIGFVLDTFVRFGADESIRYDSKPHIGTDMLRDIVKNMRKETEALGGEIRFMHCLTGIKTEDGRLKAVTVSSPEGTYEIVTDDLVLAIGHSARDTVRMLLESGMRMEPKPFSMGVRIEHKQEMINRAQFKGQTGGLPAADYKLSKRFPDGGSAYTFCMCPGGYVVAAASEQNGVVTNGMSCSARDGENANSALLISLSPDVFPYEGPLGGVKWQREIEKAAFELGGGDYRAPAQLVGDFMNDRESEGPGSVIPTYRPGVRFTDIRRCLPPIITDTLKKAIPEFAGMISGFDSYDAVLTAPETRSSSPVRILRDGSGESCIKGIFPAGEGAGYAGGIVSSAVDGIKTAEAVALG